ncbi:MAG: metallophosphoesterase [Flavobacteriales bacterium]|nr:metallophosphoesterase [Flavobacteriales bacterium]
MSTDGKPAPKDPAIAASARAALPVVKRITHALPRVSAFWTSRAGAQRMPMVGWFDPAQLASTGIKTMFSMVVGERSDRRMMLALSSKESTYYDLTCHYTDTPNGPREDRSREREDLWLDFVCDTGDGWNPTYSIAYATAQPVLKVKDTNGAVLTLPRADVLLFGGDEVYPAPSREEYQRRLVAPFTKAFGDQRPSEHPQVFAIPGNHDWYDGLNAFSRLFCSGVGGRRFAGWYSRQQRSYFALQLPGNWWLLGCDGQLQGDLDTGQIEYFRTIARHRMKSGDKVLLCLSVPVWTYAHKYRDMGREFDETDLLYLRDEVLGREGVEVKVYLTGDLHYYRRHEEAEPAAGASPVQKITAGGGGAFLHPTHEEDLSELVEHSEDPQVPPRRFTQRACYPDAKTSSRLAWGNLFFFFKNPKAGIAPAVLYLITAWLAGAAIGEVVPRHPGHALKLTGDAFGGHPGLALWSVACIAAFLAFTDTHSKVYRVLGGLAHCFAHWVALFYIGWGSWSLADQVLHGHPFLRAVATGTMIFGGGWVVGSMILGLYLLISINVFGRHSEEAFSALRIQDFKHFLRIKVSRNGELTIFSIRIGKVPRKWRDRSAADESPSAVQPVEPLEPELIEPPLVMR